MGERQEDVVGVEWSGRSEVRRGRDLQMRAVLQERAGVVHVI